MKYANYLESYATFSEDKTRRFVLFRQWDKSKPIATIIGLNPSTADDTEDDPTIGFVYRVLSNNGYGGFFMTNLFTMITPHPKELIRDEDINHAMEIWKASMYFSSTMIFAWGRFDSYGRNETAKRIYRDAMCFGKLKNGEPRHPMYLKSNTILTKFRP
jgi:hypothetical protein